MTETIAVLFIFFILVILGVVFYAKFQQVSAKQQGEEQIATKALSTTMKVLFLPELTCSHGKAEPEDFCFDLMKVRQAQSPNGVFQQNDDYYFNLFSYSTISIHQLYPETGQYVLYDRPKVRMLDNGTTVFDWTRKEPSFFVITLRDDRQREGGKDKYYFGYLEVDLYS